ncbi:hypothetical protein BH09SUM1_BH09SUM1_23370 [soil metagenome]
MKKKFKDFLPLARVASFALMVLLSALCGLVIVRNGWRYLAVHRASNQWVAAHSPEKKDDNSAAPKPDGGKPSVAASGGAQVLSKPIVKGGPKADTPKSDAAAKAEKAKDSKDPYAEIAKGGLFGPPKPETPIVLSAIIADTSIINGQTVKVGDTVGNGSKVIEIRSDAVVLEKDGVKNELKIFSELKGMPAGPG